MFMRKPTWYSREYIPPVTHDMISGGLQPESLPEPGNSDYLELQEKLTPLEGSFEPISRAHYLHLDPPEDSRDVTGFLPKIPTQTEPNDLLHRQKRTWRLRRDPTTIGANFINLMDSNKTVRPPLLPCKEAVPFQLSAVTTKDVDSLAYKQTHNYLIARQRAEARTKATHALGAAALVPLIGLSAFFADQNIVAPTIWGENTASISVVASNDYAKANVADRINEYTIGGMGIIDSEPTIAKPLIPALSSTLPHSRLFALKEGTHLQIPNTEKVFDAMQEANPAHTLILYGMSTGGIEMWYLAKHAIEMNPSLNIIMIADSSPVNADSTYELRNDPSLVGKGAFLSRAQLFGGPIVKSLVDITSANTRDKYEGPGGTIKPFNFWQEIGRIRRDVWTSKGTPNSLRLDQLAVIADGSLEDNMKLVADTSKSTEPIWIVYLSPTEDHTVDDNYSVQKYRDFVRAINKTNPQTRFTFIRRSLRGATHASENTSAFTALYNITIEEVLASIRSNSQPLQPKW